MKVEISEQSRLINPAKTVLNDVFHSYVQGSYEKVQRMFGLKKQTETELIGTTSGLVKGLVLEDVNQFIGIPYAEPPIGSLRFAKPKPLSKPIDGIIDGTVAKKACIQEYIPTMPDIEETSEDCLFLSIWSPKFKKGDPLKPVLFYIHGGALTVGSIFQLMFNGSIIAAQEVVFVSANYRLGWFGFLYGGQESAPGNVGFFDQVLALKWVRDNIHLFGGDRDQITIGGQSAGSWGVSAHLLSPVSRGLFKRAIMKSGAHIYNKDRPVMSKTEALIKAKILAAKFGCTDTLWLQCLRNVSHEKLIIPLSPVYPVDGTEFLPLLARKAFEQGNFNKDIDLLSGVVKNEGTLLTYILERDYLFKIKLGLKDFNDLVEKSKQIYGKIDVDKVLSFYLNNTDLKNRTSIQWRLYQYVGDLAIVCPTYHFAKLYAHYSSKDTNVYFYELTHTAFKDEYFFDFGVYHTSDVDLIFGKPLQSYTTASDMDKRFSRQMTKLFTDFIKTGKPDPMWPKLIGTKDLPDIDFIRDLNPHHESRFNFDLFTKSCNGFWKYYF